MTLNLKNVVLMLGIEENRFYLNIEDQLLATNQLASNYHANLWLKDSEYREKTAQTILIKNTHLLKKFKIIK